MKLDIAKTNYLQIPLIEEYYALTQILNPYRQIESNTNAKRSLYEDILDKFQPFSNIEDIEKNIEILNNTVFLHQKKIKKIPLSLPEDKIENLNSKGFNLLELNMPFNNEKLRKSYLSAIQHYHSTDDKDNKEMKNINNAYLLYRNFLSFEKYIKNEGTKAGYFNISDGKNFYFSLYSTLLKIYIDVWELDKAYEIVAFLLDGRFEDFDLCHSEDLAAGSIIQLAQKLTVIGKYDISKYLYEKVLSCPNIRANEYYMEETKERISGKWKHKVVLMHKVQAKYAFKNNVITEKRYKDAIKRFSEKEERIDISQKVLNAWLEKNSFLQLSFDEKLEFTVVDNLTPYPKTLANKNIYTMSKQQQSEYYLTFHIEPTIKLIDKYLYFRLYSYIFSLKEYKDKKTCITMIIDECRLILKLYDSLPRANNNLPVVSTSKYPSISLFTFIQDLIKWSTVGEDTQKKNHNELKIKYGYLLNMGDSLGNPYAFAPWTEKSTHQRGDMSLTEIIDELKEVYCDHASFEDMINELTHYYGFEYWGAKLCTEEFGKNLILARELFYQAVNDDNVNNEIDSLLDTIKSIASTKLLNDKAWAKEIYLKVQNRIEEYPDDLINCIEIITKDEYFGDKKWGKAIIQKALDKTNETQSILIADIVASSDGLNDKKWAKDITSLVQKIPNNFLDFILLGEKLAKKDGLNDIEGARNIAIEAAKKCEGAGCLEMIAEYVMNDLHDAKLANKIRNMPLKKVKMTTVRFIIYGGKDDKIDEYLKNVVENDTYYELEVGSGKKIEDVLSGIVRNEKFMKDVLYSTWNTILKPEFDIVGEYDSVLYIDKLIYEGVTYNNDYELSPDWPLHIASRMVFGFKEGTVSNLDY